MLRKKQYSVMMINIISPSSHGWNCHHVHIFSTKQITIIFKKGSHDCVTDAPFRISKLLLEWIKYFTRHHFLLIQQPKCSYADNFYLHFCCWNDMLISIHCYNQTSIKPSLLSGLNKRVHLYVKTDKITFKIKASNHSRSSVVSESQRRLN